MNPHRRPTAGSYKELLVTGFNHIERTKEAEMFSTGKMKLAIVSSITGNVRTLPELTKECIEALKTLDQTETVKYYIYALEAKDIVPASSEGAYVYDPQDQKAVAHLKNQFSNDKTRFGPGELYFKS